MPVCKMYQTLEGYGACKRYHDERMDLTDDDYLYLVKCTNIEFNNWCVRWLNKNK